MSRLERLLVFGGKSGEMISARVAVALSLHEAGGSAKIRHLAKQLGTEIGTTRVHVHRLETAGILWTYQDGPSIIAVLKRHALPPMAPEAEPLWDSLWEEWQERQMQAAIPQRVLEEATGYTSRETLSHLRGLERQGYVEMRQSGRLTQAIAPSLPALLRMLPPPKDPPLTVRNVFDPHPATLPTLEPALDVAEVAE